ncbi:MAG TPA: aldo/keto reductase [Candidatus Sulfotelmatobacter sp.]|nr:aldo/keto reductase [Candidatus Sulfotelmatobacter sp.]
MHYRKLGTTDIEISVICLGSMNWGEQNTEKDAHKQLDYATSQGINFIDTAEIYPIPPHAASQGRTETYIGTWLKKRQKRDEVIIASKIVGRSDMTYIRNGETPCFDRKISVKQLRDHSTDYKQTISIYTSSIGQTVLLTILVEENISMIRMMSRSPLKKR